MKEVWKSVVGYDGWYEVSNRGRVRRMQPGPNTWIGRILSAKRAEGGYVSVRLSVSNVATRFYVHDLVATAFLGKKPKNKEVNHGDLNKQNNCDWNLEYTTHIRNSRHAVRNGVYVGHYGEDNPKAKIGWQEVKKIRTLYGSGKYTQKTLANMFGLQSDSRISDIVNGKAWVERAA